ncbi:MAG: hypothetical protein KAS70_06035 [Planctomycetes bacterium]|nr:hypothetical protein [Planctomycetota bacterium]
MNFNEFHSHRWAKNFKEARQRFHSIQQLLAEKKAEAARTETTKLAQGDFADEKHIFPGLKVMAPYWKAEVEMMRCRFEAMSNHTPDPELLNTPEYTDNVKKYYDWFVEDVGALIKQHDLLPVASYDKLLKQYPPVMMENWAEVLKKLNQETDQAVKAGQIKEDLFNRWLLFCLNGIVAYNYGLIRQAVFSGVVLIKFSEDKLTEIVQQAKNEYGWQVSRTFFLEIFPAADITDAIELQTIGRYGMFSDQEIVTKEIVPPPEKQKQDPKVKTSEFMNCQEFSIFSNVFKGMKAQIKQVGSAICAYCEEHGKKNTQIFVPPSMRPELKMLSSLAFGDKKCTFETKLYPIDDMERFLKAQEKLYGTN